MKEHFKRRHARHAGYAQHPATARFAKIRPLSPARPFEGKSHQFNGFSKFANPRQVSQTFFVTQPTIPGSVGEQVGRPVLLPRQNVRLVRFLPLQVPHQKTCLRLHHR
jgi:hypothetical protein